MAIPLYQEYEQPGEGRTKLTHNPIIPSPKACLICIHAIIALLSAQ